MKKHSKLCAIFLTALLSISAVSYSVSAVGEWRELKHIRICGLMGMATNTDNDEQIKTEF